LTLCQNWEDQVTTFIERWISPKDAKVTFLFGAATIQFGMGEIARSQSEALPFLSRTKGEITGIVLIDLTLVV
jgi:hypothetical protein